MSNLIAFSLNLTDSLMIGQLGEAATSGVYVGGMVGTLLQMLLTGIEGGMQVLTSQYWGKGAVRQIRRIFILGAFVSLVIGVSATLASALFPGAFVKLFLKRGAAEEEATLYLRILSASFPFLCASGAMSASMKSIESAKIGTVAALSAFFVNFALNRLLIFGGLGIEPLGVRGAAIATVAARACECAVLVIYVTLIDKKLKRRAATQDEREGICANFFKTSIPIIAGQLVWITNTFLATYLIGKLDTPDAVPAIAIANTLNSLSYVLMNGLSGAVGILIGKEVGSGDTHSIKRHTVATEVIFIIIGILTGVILFLIRGPFVSLYNVGEGVRDMAKELIGILSLTIAGTSYVTACLGGIVRSGGDVSFILKNDAFFIFLVVIPLSVTAYKLHAPAPLLFLALKSDQLLKVPVAAIKINRFKWMRDVTVKK